MCHHVYIRKLIRRFKILDQLSLSSDTRESGKTCKTQPSAMIKMKLIT